MEGKEGGKQKKEETQAEYRRQGRVKEDPVPLANHYGTGSIISYQDPVARQLHETALGSRKDPRGQPLVLIFTEVVSP